MPTYSIFNDVLGPVMIGPSSSHTAGPTRLGLLARYLLGEEPLHCRVTFDPSGSFAHVYTTQGSDTGFAAGYLGLDPGDPQGGDALEIAKQRGIHLEFQVKPLQNAEHPNTALMELEGHARSISVQGISTGGGMVSLTSVNGYPVSIKGTLYHVLAEAESADRVLPMDVRVSSLPGNGYLFDYPFSDPPSERDLSVISEASSRMIGVIRPVLPVLGDGVPPIYKTQAEAIACAKNTADSLGKAAISYECNRSGWDEGKVRDHARKILQVIKGSLTYGLQGNPRLKLTPPTARQMQRCLEQGALLSGLTSRAAVIALAILEASNSRSVICAAPTAGSCGTLPGTLLAAAETWGSSEERVIEALMAAGGAGLIIAREATFAAEVAGCQAECGAASAMATAALLDLAGRNAEMALGGASVALQNMLGLICDPVAGLVEVPCYGRNAMAAANAFVAADMVLGGYDPLIPLEETARAMLEVGRSLHPDLKCTARGGLSIAPSALGLKEKA